MSTTCQFPRCHRTTGLSYIGRDICPEHNRLLCEANEAGREQENKLLARIGLVRDDDGSVKDLAYVKLARARKKTQEAKDEKSRSKADEVVEEPRMEAAPAA